MAANKIKITFLGTNGWYDTDTGNTICVLVETPKEYVVLDAGNGIYKLDRYIKKNKPIHLFLSHFHLDHIIGLHVLAKFKFRQGINIYVKKGFKNELKRFVSKKFTMPLGQLATRIKIFEISGPKMPVPFLEQALPLRHPVPCLGFRFNFGGKVISYVTDTGLCDNLFRLAEGADLLISECAFKVGQKISAWPHLDPKSAALMAKRAGAGKLVLVHFDADVYRTLAERKKAAKLARKIFRNTFAAEDGMSLEMGGR